MITRSRQQYLRDILLVLLMFLLELAVKVSGNPVLQRRVNKYLSAIPGQVIHFEHRINPSLYCYRFVQFGEKNLKEKHIDPFPLYLRVDRYNNYTLANTSHSARDRVTYEGTVQDGFIDIVLCNTKLTDSKTYRLYTMVQGNSSWYTVIVDYYLVCHKVDNLTAGNSTAGNSTAGNSTAGNSTAGNSTAGNSTAGNSTAGNSTSVPYPTEKPTQTSKDASGNEIQWDIYGPIIGVGLAIIIGAVIGVIIYKLKKKKKNEESIPLQPSGSQKCVEEGAKANSSHSVKATPKTGQDDEHETKEVNKWNFTPQAV